MRQTKRLIALACLLLAVCVTALADVTATLRGRVVDAKTGEALVGATVQILQAGKTAVSDNNGEFTLQGLGQRNYTLTARVFKIGLKTCAFFAQNRCSFYG